jgi:predicted nucleotide-binding protein
MGNFEQDNRQNVYVINGRNTAIQNAMYDFLSTLGLQLITKEDAVEALKRGSPFADEVLEMTLKSARAIIVPFTEGEQVRLRSELRKSDDKNDEAKFLPQPGMDQIFEAGYALGRFPERTILIQIGQVQLFSDIDGRYIPNFTGKEADRRDLINRLKSIGCILQEDKNTWRNAGNFQQASTGPQLKRNTKKGKPKRNTKKGTKKGK